ncbi:hypothetical protein BP6252_06164 [Coleophoma cylindrospora]|uniref:Amidohydrolase-related domain-containing protein n=1 Tax=Coleophoma cylindrospora TaxID=1849047 RepID=A0A3D8RLP8_9HELO|nr:hypothetical protein BP6252_06164 [Coleophoma cylindrospora]
MSRTVNGTRLDTHVHVVPDWYRVLTPNTGGSPTPAWDIQSHLEFMASNDIGHSIVSISTPGSGVFLGNETASIGLARLLNELIKTYPKEFSFYATIPLPYTQAAIVEAAYALDHLGAIGVILLTSHEGKYLGNSAFTPFYRYLQTRNSSREVIFIHPTDPVLNLNGSFISANPTIYPPGLAEYYFETARTIVDLTVSQTILNFTEIQFLIPQAGGAFPAVEDRFLKSAPALEGPSKQVYSSRFWYDSAGPVYFAQVLGLLGYNVPTSQLVFGTDYPYSHVPYGTSINAILDASFLTANEKQDIFYQNTVELFGGHIYKA